MESGDGLLVRVRPRWGRLKAAELRDIARLALGTGNGVIELTRRANLQLRGVSHESWPRLRDELVQLGLAAASLEGERLPALHVCPLTGLDSRSPTLEPLAASLEEMIAELPAARSLSHKFSIVLSGGSRLSGGLAADVHVRLHPAPDGLADIVVAGTLHGGVLIARSAASEVPSLLRGSLEELVSSGARRMRDVAFGPGLAELVPARGELPLGAASGWSRALSGFQKDVRSWVGVAVPFGSAEAEAWSVVADTAEQYGSGEVRLTPARQVLLPDVPAAAAGSALERLARAGFELREPSAGVELVACSGAPACRSALGETRRLARELGAVLGPRGGGLSVHVSGCEKSCARDGKADVTVVCGKGGAHLGFGTGVLGARAAPILPLSALGARIARHFSGPDAPREHAGPSL